MGENPYQTTDSVELSQSGKSGNRLTRFIRRLLIVLGSVFGFLIILLVIGGIFSSKTYKRFEGRATPFIESFLISQKTWNYESAQEYLGKEWFDSTTQEDGVKIFGAFGKLGEFRSISDVAWIGCTTGPNTERCDYRATTQYENGAAQISFGLVIEEGDIKITQIHINSDVFLM